MIRGYLFVLAVAAGCNSAAADHERLGDKAYGEGRYADAVAEYRAAQKSGGRPRTSAKLGSAALHSRDIGVAIDAYSTLGTVDPSRRAEAAAGLERAAHLAERGGTPELLHLAAAVRAIRTLSPGRPLGRFALTPAIGLPPAEALGMLPAALASAADSRTVDTLLVAFGSAQRVTTACESATRTLQTALRRTRDPGLRKTASEGVSTCALRLGLDALSGEQAETAERWFETAIATAAGTPTVWRAQIGLGDARLSQGDILGAAIAFQSVLSAAGVPDSLSKLATDKLNALSGAPSPALEDLR